MRTMLKIRVLTIGVSCALVGALAVPMARAAPELGVTARAGALLSAGLTHWESAPSAVDERLAASPLGSAEAVRAATLVAAPELNADAAGPTEMSSSQVPHEGPASPTPFSLALAGLLGVGFWMQRRRRRMLRPLI